MGSKYVKTKALSFLPFKWKIGLLFALFVHFWAKKGWGQRLQDQNQSLTQPIPEPPIAVNWIRKNFGPPTFQFCCHWCQTTFQKKIWVWLLFSVPRPFFEKNKFHFLMQNLILNRLPPFKIKKKQQKACMPFSISHFAILAIIHLLDKMN